MSPEGTAACSLLPLGVLVATLAAGLHAQAAPPIADNSFFLEEAYNQEPGVVQHISAFFRVRATDSWVYTFTQEWPVSGQRHQLSFTLPVQRVAEGPAPTTGIGDVALNYRYQLLGGERRVAAAPRLSLLLPTGKEERGHGAGALGMQVNLPMSVTLARRLVSHWNAGATVIPSARDAGGATASTVGYNAGMSVIWLARPHVNLVFEVSWTRAEAVTGPGTTTASEALFLHPGIRWAHNFSSGLQIVPGIGVPLGLGASRGEDGVFAYLSFEHPFGKRGRSEGRIFNRKAPLTRFAGRG